jgi:hypothetical protein
VTPQGKVERYIGTIERHPQAELDDLVDALRCEAIDEEEAECLVAFVPMAFAHAVLAPSGVGLPSGFIVRDFDTGESARGRLDEEPIFLAARTMADGMLNAGPSSSSRARGIAATSAEMHAANQLGQEDGGMKGIVLTEAVLMRVPVEHVKRRTTRRRWKFWK